MPSELIGWLSSYLEDRRQYVKITAMLSRLMHVTSGVAQRSLLGLFLFSIVMGSLKIQSSNCCAIKCADDVTLGMPIYKDVSNLHTNQANLKPGQPKLAFSLTSRNKKLSSFLCCLYSPIYLLGFQIKLLSLAWFSTHLEQLYLCQQGILSILISTDFLLSSINTNHYKHIIKTTVLFSTICLTGRRKIYCVR